MTDRAAPPSMMRFEPDSGWSAAVTPVSSDEHNQNDNTPPSIQSAPSLSADALLNIGESMQEVFENLKIGDSRLQGWNQVHAALRLLGAKLQERKALQERLSALEEEIKGIRGLAMEVVKNAHHSEQEVHETSKLRMQIAESLNEKLSAALKD